MSKLSDLIAELNNSNPLPEVAAALDGTTFDIVSIRVDDDGDLIKVSYMTNGPHSAPGRGINLPTYLVADYTDEDDTWEMLYDQLEEGLAEVLD
jgi:hypothetical protein